MTRYTPLWQQAGTYPANTDRGLLTTLWPYSGSVGGAATTVSNTMQVSVAPGTAAVVMAGAGGTELCRWDAAEVVTLTAAPPAGQSRIDVVVLQVRDNALDAGGNNDFIFQAIAGTPTTGTPVAPAVPTNAYPICQLTVPGGAANLNGVTVTNRRSVLATPATAARVYQAAAQSFANGAATRVNFDTVDYDFAGIWSPAGQAMTALATGVYLVTARCEFSVPSGAVDRAFLEAWVNGSGPFRRGADYTFTSGGANMAVQLSTQLRMGAGNTFDVRGLQVTGGAANSIPGLYQTFLEFALLGSN